MAFVQPGAAACAVGRSGSPAAQKLACTGDWYRSTMRSRLKLRSTSCAPRGRAAGQVRIVEIRRASPAPGHRCRPPAPAVRSFRPRRARHCRRRAWRRPAARWPSPRVSCSICLRPATAARSSRGLADSRACRRVRRKPRQVAHAGLLQDALHMGPAGRHRPSPAASAAALRVQVNGATNARARLRLILDRIHPPTVPMSQRSLPGTGIPSIGGLPGGRREARRIDAVVDLLDPIRGDPDALAQVPLEVAATARRSASRTDGKRGAPTAIPCARPVESPMSRPCSP